MLQVIPGKRSTRASSIHACTVLAACVIFAFPPSSNAAEPVPSDGSSTRTGPFNLLDSRSTYGLGVFPEPFLVDDSDAEVNEFRLDWLHAEASGSVSNSGTAEIEKGFGLLTLEVEVPYESDETSSFDPTSGTTVRQREHGFDNVDLGARAPIYQYVSNNGVFDTTFGVAVEVGVPTNSPVSKNAEFVPKIFNDTRIGEHFTIQSIIGYSILYGSGEDGGSHTFEYGFDFGYTVDRHDLPLPGVESVIHLFELAGETALNHDDSGHNSLLGNAAVRLNLRSIGSFQPRLGVGYVFPIDKGARDDLRWGIYTSLVFEF